MNGATTLYRFFDSRGRCIYVGITDDVRARFNAHRRTAWWREVADIEKVTYPTRAEAAAAETEAIRTLAPRYNVVHNEGRQKIVGAPAVSYLSLQETAEYLGVSTKTIRRYVSRGNLRAFRAGTRLLRFDIADVENLLRVVPTVTGGAR